MVVDFLEEYFLLVDEDFLVDEAFLGGISLINNGRFSIEHCAVQIMMEDTHQMIPCGSFTHFNVLRLQHVTPECQNVRTHPG